jgi:hypothetical protein
MAGNRRPGFLLSPSNRLEIAMKTLRCLATVAVLASTLAACASPYYYNRAGYYQAYGYPTTTTYYNSPGVTVAYTTGPSYAYAYPSYTTYNSGGWDYYRNYRGIHPGPEYYP